MPYNFKYFLKGHFVTFDISYFEIFKKKLLSKLRMDKAEFVIKLI